MSSDDEQHTTEPTDVPAEWDKIKRDILDNQSKIALGISCFSRNTYVRDIKKDLPKECELMDQLLHRATIFAYENKLPVEQVDWIVTKYAWMVDQQRWMYAEGWVVKG
jgi:hypothetical protein